MKQQQQQKIDVKVKIPILTLEDYTDPYTSLMGPITQAGTLQDS